MNEKKMKGKRKMEKGKQGKQRNRKEDDDEKEMGKKGGAGEMAQPEER